MPNKAKQTKVRRHNRLDDAFQPCGPIARESLDAEDAPVLSKGPYAKGAGARLDWYNDRLQILVDDGPGEDVALHVRLNRDGTIAEILVRDDLFGLCRRESSPERSEWQEERDNH